MAAYGFAGLGIMGREVAGKRPAISCHFLKITKRRVRMRLFVCVRIRAREASQPPTHAHAHIHTHTHTQAHTHTFLMVGRLPRSTKPLSSSAIISFLKDR